jgi:hypothetical protein
MRSGTVPGGGRTVDPRLAVIDDEQPTAGAGRRMRGGRLGAFEKMPQRQHLVGLGHIFRARRMEHQRLAVARDFQISVRLFVDPTDVPEERVHLVPAEVVRERMLEDRLIGPQM